MKIEDTVLEIEQLVVDVMMMIQHEFGTEYDNRLSSNQQVLLYLIGRHEVKYVKDLSHHLNVSPSAVSQMLSKLEQMELVKRKPNEENRRTVPFELDDEGIVLLEHMERTRQTIMTKYLTKIPEDDLAHFRDVYKKLRDIMLEEKEGSKE
ncbi:MULTISPECIES: MarR family winged helix-turn-helix transcriptional regulator [Alteribacter]|uniref:MarR family transcriptional regulator n=1 Tax=Alteribacter keqinensis TaxID=2483800 RepID=A0A3M7TXX6_9BACI|nr:MULTISPECIES: MarR family transcriptional regulator [Alteribacter]MBM7097641.1 MarR family transcriptional regulator [Alteribacter salitolerans]RNA70141.1 MarR family transcriptional regulator [Alteribacter keqinensis]